MCIVFGPLSSFVLLTGRRLHRAQCLADFHQQKAVRGAQLCSRPRKALPSPCHLSLPTCQSKASWLTPPLCVDSSLLAHWIATFFSFPSGASFPFSLLNTIHCSKRHVEHKRTWKAFLASTAAQKRARRETKDASHNVLPLKELGRSMGHERRCLCVREAGV